MLTIKDFCFSPFQENTYVLYNELKHAIIIDPGCYTRMEEKMLTDFINPVLKKESYTRVLINVKRF